jgi:hypothetical protein
MRDGVSEKDREKESLEIMHNAANNVMFGIDYGETNTSSYSFMIS